MNNGEAAPRTRISLQQQVGHALDEYFDTLDGESPCDLYALVMAQVERPLLESVMKYVDHNQSRAAAILGMSRGTLRKKLMSHGIL